MSLCVCLYAYCLLSIFKLFISLCVCVCDRERDRFNEFSIVNVFYCQPCISHWPRPGVSNPAPGELPSYRFQLQPQSNTPEPANQGVQGYLIITDRCVGAGLELKSAGW